MKTYSAIAAALFLGLVLADGIARATECSEAAARACQQIDLAIYEDDPERLELALDRWEAACGLTELVWRTRILGAIWAGTYSDSLLGPDPVGRMLRYRHWYTGESLPALAPGDSSLYPLDDGDEFVQCQDLADFVIDFAAQLVPYLPERGEEELLARFFAGEIRNGFAWAQRDSIASPNLLQSHADWLRRASSHQGYRTDLSLHLGQWRSGPGFERIGNRFVMGGAGAVVSGRTLARLLGEVRIGNSRRDYVVREGDDLFDTNAFTGLLFGGEVGFTALRWKNLSLTPVGGFGWHGVEALPAEEENGVDALWIHSFARTIGFDLHFFQPKGRGSYLSFGVRHEWNDFDAGRGGDELEGQGWILRLSFGIRKNPVRDAWRRALAAP